MPHTRLRKKRIEMLSKMAGLKCDDVLTVPQIADLAEQCRDYAEAMSPFDPTRRYFIDKRNTWDRLGLMKYAQSVNLSPMEEYSLLKAFPAVGLKDLLTVTTAQEALEKAIEADAASQSDEHPPYQTIVLKRRSEAFLSLSAILEKRGG